MDPHAHSTVASGPPVQPRRRRLFPALPPVGSRGRVRAPRSRYLARAERTIAVGGEAWGAAARRSANNETTPASDATTPRQLTWCPATVSLRSAHALRTPFEWLDYGGAAARRLPRRCGRAPGRRHRGVGRRHKRPVRGPFSAVSTTNWTRPGCRDMSDGPFQRSQGPPLPFGHFQGPLAPVHHRHRGPGCQCQRGFRSSTTRSVALSCQ